MGFRKHVCTEPQKGNIVTLKGSGLIEAAPNVRVKLRTAPGQRVRGFVRRHRERVLSVLDGCRASVRLDFVNLKALSIEVFDAGPNALPKVGLDGRSIAACAFARLE